MHEARKKARTIDKANDKRSKARRLNDDKKGKKSKKNRKKKEKKRK